MEAAIYCRWTHAHRLSLLAPYSPVAAHVGSRVHQVPSHTLHAIPTITHANRNSLTFLEPSTPTTLQAVIALPKTATTMANRPLSPGGVSDCSADDSDRVFTSESRLSLARQGKALQSSFLTEEDQPGQPPPRAFLPPSSSPQNYRDSFSLVRSELALKDTSAGACVTFAEEKHEEIRPSDGRVYNDDSSSGVLGTGHLEHSSDSLVDFSCGIARRKLSLKLGSRRNTERLVTTSKSVRWASGVDHSSSAVRAARFAGSRSMPDTMGYDDAAERRARAQFARSRNNARIWGSARSNGSRASTDFAEESGSGHQVTRSKAPTMVQALQNLLPCAKNDSYFKVVCATTASLSKISDNMRHCEALLQAGRLFNETVQDKVEVWPVQMPAPTVVAKGRGLYFATASPFGEAVAIVAAMMAMHGNVTVRRKAHRVGQRLVVALNVKSGDGGLVVKVEISERGDENETIDVGIVRRESVLLAFSSKRKDAFGKLRDDIKIVWASVGTTPRDIRADLSSSRLLKSGGVSWRKRKTSLV